MNWIDARVRRPVNKDELLIVCADGYCTVTFYSKALNSGKWTHCGTEVRYWVPLHDELLNLEGVIPGKWRHEEPRFADWDNEAFADWDDEEEEEENEQRI